MITYPAGVADFEKMFEAALETGAEDVIADSDGHEISCEPDDFSAVHDGLENMFGAATDARLDWKAKSTVSIDEAIAQTLFKLLDTLEDNDDVQRVAANFEVDDTILEKLSA